MGFTAHFLFQGLLRWVLRRDGVFEAINGGSGERLV